LAENTTELAKPLALVTAVLTSPAKVPLAPFPGGANVTVTPGTGLLKLSLTVACNVEANAVFTVAFCGVPAVAVTLAAAPGLLVRLKLVESAPAAAVTVYGPPAVAFAVNEAEATPKVLVTKVMVGVLLLNTPEAPETGAVKVTFTPDTGLLPASRTVTARALENAVLIAADCDALLRFAPINAAAPAVFVRLKLVDSAPLAAVTVYGPPAVTFAVNGAEATPNTLVATVIVAVLLLNTPEAPEVGAVNVTFTPETGLLPASRTVTARALANAVLIVADCGVVPGFALIDVAAPAVFVRLKPVESAPVAAVTVYGPPAVPFAVNGTEATPQALVAAVIVAVLLLNTPEAPEAGAVKVTFTPDTGSLSPSRTVTARALAKGVLIVADCGVEPGFAAIEAGFRSLPKASTQQKTPITAAAIKNFVIDSFTGSTK
jgi:hypothetical protein